MTQPAPPPAPRTQTMYSPDGSPVEVPLAEVASAARSGKLGFAAGQTVHIEDPNAGGIVPMSGDAASAFFSKSDSFGTGVAHASDFQLQERRKQLETVGNQAAAAGLGAARGLTLGASDLIATEVGGENTRKYLADQQKINPGLSTVGEVAGMVAPALFTGGASAEAGLVARTGRAATVLPRGVTALGEGAGALAKGGAKALGLAEEGRAVALAESVGRNAVEGSLYGVGQAVSDASLKGDPITAEKLLAAGWKGGLLGGALGGSLTAAGGLAKAGGGKVKALLSGGAKEADALGVRAIEGEAGVLAGEAGALAPAAEKSLLQRGEEFGTKKLAEQVGLKTEGRTQQEILKDLYETQTLSSITPTSERVQKKIDAWSKEFREMAVETIDNDFRRLAGMERGAVMPRAQMAESAVAFRKEAGQELGSLVKSFDDAAARSPTVIKPSMPAIASDIERDVLKPLMENSLGDGGLRARIAKDLRRYTADYQKAGELSFEKAHEMRQKLFETINKQPKSVEEKVRNEAFREAYKAVNNEFTTKAQAAIGEAGGDAALMWSKANKKYALAADLDEMAARGAYKDAKNRVTGLSEQLTGSRFADVGKTVFGSAGAAAGSMFGPAGMAFGAAAGSFLGGAAGSLAGQRTASMVRRYGDQDIARIAREAATDGVLRATVNRVSDRLGGGVSKITSSTAAAAIAQGGSKAARQLPGISALATEAERIGNRAAASRDDEYKAKRQQYADLASSPRAREEATAAIRQTHPELAKSLDRKLAEIAAYVDKRAPLSTRALATLTPNAVKDTVSPGQRAQFLELTKVAEDPLSVLDDLQSGRVTASQMRAVRDLYPALHAEIAAKVIDKLADRTEPLPYKKRLEIGLLIGAPTDASLEPAMIAAAQSTFAPPPNAAPPPRASTSAATPTRQLAATTKMAGLEAGAE